ncbi:FMN-binding negative transcriptional regulator [Hufsiella ginkgonis]|uniref:FMN-binding negative transcriptional regulator n=1 Tax=Hufsiella ginkgonis TaxID=2695274 RepID=A0A7K1XUF6_9SPHI|nr:FMN-binding negative transcriptional regulator [Hufsiella ginkgonis]MXV14399.1 FMN-binding negative transcriptional regulator [Hufsiella ginkgonis]
MYIPKNYLLTDFAAITSFMQQYSFGTLVSNHENIPEATHIPFVIEVIGDQVHISSHMARSNPQAARMENQEVLIIFTEPHAYISPRHYEKEQNVPTWNYLAVHVYGRVQVTNDPQRKQELLEKMIGTYEKGYMEQWKRLPEQFKANNIKGITAFEIEITDIQAKNKLSQNKTETERKSIISELGNSGDTNERDIARYMSQLEIR